MLKKILLFLLVVLICVFAWTKTPISSGYYFSKGIKQYDAKHYKESLILFERALLNSPQNSQYRLHYVKALSKSGTNYSVQKRLYEIANSDINDAAKSEAKTQIIQLRHKLMEGVEDNYIYNAVLGKQIVHWDIKKFPIKVYIEPAVGIPPYYKLNIEKAMADWSKRTNFIKFSQVNDKKSANIYVKFKDYTSKDCDPNGCRYMVAYTDPVINTKGVLDRMDLTFYKTNPQKYSFTQREIYNTALHEFGHTLGLMGHSDNSSDIMYANGDKVNDDYAIYRSELQNISMRDLKTLALLYKMAPTVSNTPNIKNENYYYGPLILGSDEEVLRKKLVEMERYIKNYPNFAAGYINISTVYADLGEFDKAFQHLAKAQRLAKTQDELYLINYNYAAFYYNKGDFPSALAYAQRAKGIKPSQEIDDLIEEIKQLK